MTDAERLILKLTADLRQMDQLVWSMGQCTSWGQMRPFFLELQALQEARMREESNRICAALIPEIVRTYANADTGSQEAPSVPPTLQLEGPKDARPSRLPLLRRLLPRGGRP